MSTQLSEVEVNKDLLNLYPTLAFVQNNLQLYENFLRMFMKFPAQPIGAVESFKVTGKIPANGVLLQEQQIRDILSRLPQTFQELSLLASIETSYTQLVPVPEFDMFGIWTKGVDMVPEFEFPRPGQHPHRILIGYSDGSNIYPSALPAVINESARVRWFYQLHVLLHEFFHTIEWLRRQEGKMDLITLQGVVSSTPFTLSYWWKKWEAMYLAKKCPTPTSRYASTYLPDITEGKHSSDYVAFTHALAEQIAESFVGYVIGIVPNDQGSIVFKEHSPEAWELMRELATARIIQS